MKSGLAVSRLVVVVAVAVVGCMGLVHAGVAVSPTPEPTVFVEGAIEKRHYITITDSVFNTVTNQAAAAAIPDVNSNGNANNNNIVINLANPTPTSNQEKTEDSNRNGSNENDMFDGAEFMYAMQGMNQLFAGNGMQNSGGQEYMQYMQYLQYMQQMQQMQQAQYMQGMQCIQYMQQLQNSNNMNYNMNSNMNGQQLSNSNTNINIKGSYYGQGNNYNSQGNYNGQGNFNNNANVNIQGSYNGQGGYYGQGNYNDNNGNNGNNGYDGYNNYNGYSGNNYEQNNYRNNQYEQNDYRDTRYANDNYRDSRNNHENQGYDPGYGNGNDYYNVHNQYNITNISNSQEQNGYSNGVNKDINNVISSAVSLDDTYTTQTIVSLGYVTETVYQDVYITETDISYALETYYVTSDIQNVYSYPPANVVLQQEPYIVTTDTAELPAMSYAPSSIIYSADEIADMGRDILESSSESQEADTGAVVGNAKVYEEPIGKENKVAPKIGIAIPQSVTDTDTTDNSIL
ncbi:hypothetical protein H4S06_002133 [Coemansia sp. BCRC 34490]|nr:hypothetical protein H4S06_002133 [Coemansia sp. BCRC 34490]